jgi:hypothetical protein
VTVCVRRDPDEGPLLIGCIFVASTDSESRTASQVSKRKSKLLMMQCREPAEIGAGPPDTSRQLNMFSCSVRSAIARSTVLMYMCEL